MTACTATALDTQHQILQPQSSKMELCCIMLIAVVAMCNGQMTAKESVLNINIPDLEETLLRSHLELLQLKERLKKTEDQLAEITQNGKWQCGTSGGVNFARWGRTVCPANTTLIYKGYAAKAAWPVTGGAVNFQCLPETPEWTGEEVEGFQGNSRIDGVQYWADNVLLFPANKNYHDMPCAVCEVFDRAQTLMIPAKISCPAGWQQLYHGILMAARHSHTSSSTYICVDSDFEYNVGKTGINKSGYVIPVEVFCGVIPCGSYVEGYELSCVVCTK